MKSLLLGASGAALLLASPSLALTPAEFVEDFKALYTEQGLTVEIGNESTEGETVVLSDVSFAMANDDGVMVSASIDELRFAPTSEQGYEVAVTHSSAIVANSSSEIEGETISFAIEGTMDGGYLVRENDDVLEILLDYSNAIFNLSDFEGGADAPPMTLEITMEDLAGTASFALEAGEQSFDYGAASMGYSVNVDSPDDGTFDISGGYTDLNFKGQAGIFDNANPEAMFTAETPLNMTMSSATSTFAMKGDGPEGALDMSLTGGASELLAMIGEGQIDYTFTGNDLDLALAGDMIPVPVEAQMAGYETRFAMPMVPTGKPGEMAVRVSITDLTVAEALWGMIDPSGNLPRDPANIMLDVVSKASALVSLMDEEALLSSGMPFEFEDVELKNLRVSVAGAEVLGKGSAVMNNAGPFPMPVGGLDVEIKGVNGLIGKLTEMGLVQPEQAMPVQMMMGMFAKPGEEPDSFTSRVEMTEGGGITANGIPLQ